MLSMMIHPDTYYFNIPSDKPDEGEKQVYAAYDKISRIRNIAGSTDTSNNPEISIEGTAFQITKVLNLMRRLGHEEGFNILLDPGSGSSAEYLAPGPPNLSRSVHTLSSNGSEDGLGRSVDGNEHSDLGAIEGQTERTGAEEKFGPLPTFLAPPTADLYTTDPYPRGRVSPERHIEATYNDHALQDELEARQLAAEEYMDRGRVGGDIAMSDLALL